MVNPKIKKKAEELAQGSNGIEAAKKIAKYVTKNMKYSDYPADFKRKVE